MANKFYGLYCEQCNVWIRKEDRSLLFYPVPELAQAELSAESPFVKSYLPHLWAVVEFGKERYVKPDEIAAGASICPSHPDRQFIYA